MPGMLFPYMSRLHTWPQPGCTFHRLCIDEGYFASNTGAAYGYGARHDAVTQRTVREHLVSSYTRPIALHFTKPPIS